MQDYGFLSETFMFRGLLPDEISYIFSDISPEIADYSRGEIITHSGKEKKLGFIIRGKCEVKQIKKDGTSVILNTLSDGDSFGILSIFTEEHYPTEVYALKNTTVLFLTGEAVKHITDKCPKISKNIIEFLASRVVFLNRKIETFAGTRVEDRLSSYLLCRARALGTEEFPLNCKKCSEAINAGRASVYRALSSLEDEGLITLADKKIKILNLNGLERISK